MHGNTALRTAHPGLRPEWRMPSIPDGFDALVCCDYGTRCELDFLSQARKDFASETVILEIEWPWHEGFRPTANDWRAIGIDVIDFR